MQLSVLFRVNRPGSVCVLPGSIRWIQPKVRPLTCSITTIECVKGLFVFTSTLLPRLNFYRGSRKMSFKRAAFWTLFWVAMALIFNTGVYYYLGDEKALEFATGYVIELSLSMDNLFLFLMLFSYFGIPAQYQRRVLNWGIAGAIILRLIFILLGVAIIERFGWILYIFGAILIVTSFKIIFGKDGEVDPEKNYVAKLFKRFMPVTDELQEQRFFIRKNGILMATPLFVVVLVLESTDILFAIDSIPAIFAITTDPFIVYTSNLFAIIGLRSMYFFLEKVQHAFIYVKQGVGVILFITGVKMLLHMFHIKVPISVALGLIVGILIISVLASIFFSKKDKSQLQEK